MLHESYQMTRLSTLTSIVEEAMSDQGGEPSVHEAFKYQVAIFADWRRSGPTVAALHTFAHMLGQSRQVRLALVLSGRPDLTDRTALAVLLDALSDDETLRNVVLLSRDEAEMLSFDAAYEPKYDDADLLAFSGFTNSLFDLARSADTTPKLGAGEARSATPAR